jgi:hypothetical protein
MISSIRRRPHTKGVVKRTGEKTNDHTSVGAGGKSLGVKPYHLCHWRLGRAAQLLAHKQCSYDARERCRPENPI